MMVLVFMYNDYFHISTLVQVMYYVYFHQSTFVWLSISTTLCAYDIHSAIESFEFYPGKGH